MNSRKPDIYIGSRVEHASERAVLERLLIILAREKRPAIIMANMNLNGRQIDLVVAFDNLTLVIEAKGYTRPVRGGENGNWQIQLASGGWKDFPNPYMQALTAMHSLRDAMRTFAGSEIPYYPSSALIFVPQIPSRSFIHTGDFKVSITNLDGLDAEIQKKRSNCWNIAQWKDFAHHHHLIQVSDLKAACDPVLFNAEVLLIKYTNAYSQMYGPCSDELVGLTCKADDQEISSDEVARRVSDERADFLLRGPSGCGKTLLSSRIGMDWIKAGGVPLTIPSKDFQGKLRDVLDSEIGLLDAPSAVSLLRAALRLNRPLLFILDGYNECQDQERANLTRGISALLRRYKANILVTSQIPITRPDLLVLQEIEVRPPSSEVKLAIAQKAAGSKITFEVKVLLDSVESGLEARLAGTAGKEISKCSSRYALFDTFARKRLGGTAIDGIRALSRIAHRLSERIAFTLSIRDLDRLMDAEHLPASLFDQLINAKLLTQRRDRVSFSHELFYNAFAADAVIRHANGQPNPIVAALANPRHADRKEMIIGAIDDDHLLLQVLEKITDSRVVASCLSGTCGRHAREWAEARFPGIFQRMGEEVGRVQFVISDEGWMNVSIVQDALEKWCELDRACISCLPEFLAQGHYLREMLDISATMDSRIEEETIRLRDQARERKIPLRSSLFATCYVFQQPVSTGLTYVCSRIQSLIFRRASDEQLAVIVREKLSEPELSPGQIYLLLALCSQTVERGILTAPLIQQTIEKYWSKAPYHLQLDLMQAAGGCWGANEVEKIALIAAIDALPQTKNIMLSTAIVDSLQRLGAFEESEFEHQKDVRLQVDQFLSDPEDEKNCSAAYNIYYAQFDHPLSGAYSEVVAKLSNDERKKFLIMAAKGVIDSDLFLPLLLLDLVSFNDPKLGEIIGRWTEVPPLQSFLPQHAIEVFLVAHISLGRLGCDLPVRTTSGNQSANALTACGKILYWSNHIDIDEDERRSSCIESLNVLLQNTGVAVDAIRQCEHVLFKGTRGAESLKTSIIDCFPEKTTEICRQALRYPAIQSGYFRHFSERDRTEVLEFALEILGQYGNEADSSLLRRFSDDSNLGQSAIKAIKKLEQRVKLAL